MKTATRRAHAPQAEDPQAIEFSCGDCERRIRVSADLAGEQGLCPGCFHAILVPWRSQPTRRVRPLENARAHRALRARPEPEPSAAGSPARRPRPQAPYASSEATVMGILSALAVCCNLLYLFG